MAGRSPQSISYLVYGIGTRGVIGIDKIGELAFLDVDKVGGNHYHATYLIGNS